MSGAHKQVGTVLLTKCEDGAQPLPGRVPRELLALRREHENRPVAKTEDPVPAPAHRPPITACQPTSSIDDARRNLEGLSIPNKIRELVDQQDATSPKVLQDAASYFSVFISYRHADAAFARPLCNAFESRGVRAWLDEKQMVPGQYIDEAIQAGIQVSDRFVLCCSKSSLENSWWVDSEMSQVFEKERELSQGAGRKLSVVIPVMLDDFSRADGKGPKPPSSAAVVPPISEGGK